MNKGHLHSHFEIALESVNCFLDDGTLDLGEVNFLLGLALRDGVVDDDEKRVLSKIFAKIEPRDVSPMVWQRIQAVKQQYGI